MDRFGKLIFVLAAASLAACGSSSSSSGGGGGAAGSTGGGGGAAGSAGRGGAGGAGGAAGGMVTHCDVTNAGTQTCIEYEADYTGSRPQGCAVLQGTYSTGTCSSLNSSGGCRRSYPGGGTEIDFYYAPGVDVATVMVQCANDGNATYVAP